MSRNVTVDFTQEDEEEGSPIPKVSGDYHEYAINFQRQAHDGLRAPFARYYSDDKSSSSSSSSSSSAGSRDSSHSRGYGSAGRSSHSSSFAPVLLGTADCDEQDSERKIFVRTEPSDSLVEALAVQCDQYEKLNEHLLQAGEPIIAEMKAMDGQFRAEQEEDEEIKRTGLARSAGLSLHRMSCRASAAVRHEGRSRWPLIGGIIVLGGLVYFIVKVVQAMGFSADTSLVGTNDEENLEILDNSLQVVSNQTNNQWPNIHRAESLLIVVCFSIVNQLIVHYLRKGDAKNARDADEKIQQQSEALHHSTRLIGAQHATIRELAQRNIRLEQQNQSLESRVSALEGKSGMVAASIPGGETRDSTVAGRRPPTGGVPIGLAGLRYDALIASSARSARRTQVVADSGGSTSTTTTATTSATDSSALFTLGASSSRSS